MLARIELVARIGAALAVLIFFGSLSCMLWRAPNLFLHTDGVLTRTEVTLSKVYAVAGNADKATGVWADAAKDQAQDVHSLVQAASGAVQSARSAFDAVPVTLTHVNGTADAATGLLSSAQRSTDALPPLLGSVKTAVDGVRPVEDSATRATDSLNDLLKSKAVMDIPVQVDFTLTDFSRIMRKTADDYTRKVPIWQKPFKYFGDVWDIGAAVARHTP